MNAQINLVVKLAIAKLAIGGKVTGIKVCADGHNLQIGSIEAKGDYKDAVVVVSALLAGNVDLKSLDVPVEAKGDGDFVLTVRNVKYAAGGNVLELEELEFTSVYEAFEFVASVKGENLDRTKYRDVESANNDNLAAAEAV